MIREVVWVIAVIATCFSYVCIVTGILIAANAAMRKVIMRVRRAGGRPRGRHVHVTEDDASPQSKSAPNELMSGYILPDRLPQQHPATKPLPKFEPVDPVLLTRVLTGLKTPQRRHHG
jgi:hypothetical protein